MRYRKVLPFLVLFLAALACARTSATVLPTTTPDATTMALAGTTAATMRQLLGQGLTQTAQAQLGIVSPSLAPTPTDTPDPSERFVESAPAEAIFIIEPAIASAVTSPVHVAGEADSTFEQNLVVQITDAEGSIIATVSTTIQADLGQRGPFSVDAPFTVTAEQPGRISVFAASARDGGITHLSSVEVTLKPR